MLTRYTAGALALLILAGCDPATPSGDGPGGAVTFEAAFPPIPEGLGFTRDNAGAPARLMAAYANALLTPGYVSLDNGLTWERLPAPVGNPVLFDGGPRGVASGATAGGLSGAVRFDLTAGTYAPIPAPDGVQTIYPNALRSRDGALFVTTATNGVDGPTFRLRGDVWTQFALPDVNGQPYIPVSITADNASTIYVLLRRPLSPWIQHVAVSEDDGASWAVRSLPQQQSRGAVKALPSGTLLVLGSQRGMLRSTDKGQSWQQVNPPGGGTSSIPDVQALPDGEVWYRGYRARDGAAPWTRVVDLSDLGLSTASTDQIVVNETGGFLIANQTSGVFVAPASGSPLAYAGGFDLPTQGATRISPNESVITFPDGSALTSFARYDPGSRRWLWTGVGGTFTRLRDGRIARHEGCAVRFSSDDGRTWGPPAAKPVPDGQLRCAGTYGVFSLSDGRLVASEDWSPAGGGDPVGRLFASTDQGQSFSLVRFGRAYAAAGTTLYGRFERYPDGGVSEPEPWDNRIALTSLPGEGVLFVSGPDINVFKRLENGRETTLGPLSGLSLIYEGGWVAGADDDAHIYVQCGAPLRQFCRSTRPLR